MELTKEELERKGKMLPAHPGECKRAPTTSWRWEFSYTKKED
jgi:hypothetical protein